MVKIISPDHFKTTPWKNGQGETTELAISPGGTLTEFDWRISMATVLNHGSFSDFSGYHRHLVLMEGNGIELTHDESTVDVLQSPLSVASFDGACSTVGHLLDGPIRDFNVMSNETSFKAKVKTCPKQQNITFTATTINFIYAVTHSIQIELNQKNIELPKNNLLVFSDQDTKDFRITGKEFIVTSLQSLT
jgi:hypothetical protein